MSKIYPSENKRNGLKQKGDDDYRLRPSTLTVWKRSSMSFQGTDGFTVFDQQGRLVFRVENYSRNHPCVAASGLVLMDGAGNALLSLKPQVNIRVSLYIYIVQRLYNTALYESLMKLLCMAMDRY